MEGLCSCVKHNTEHVVRYFDVGLYIYQNRLQNAGIYERQEVYFYSRRCAAPRPFPLNNTEQCGYNPHCLKIINFMLRSMRVWFNRVSMSRQVQVQKYTIINILKVPVNLQFTHRHTNGGCFEFLKTDWIWSILFFLMSNPTHRYPELCILSDQLVINVHHENHRKYW